MNLTEALNVALPELPAKTAARKYPRLHPKLVGRERLEDGKPLVTCVISGKTWLYQFPPEQWQLLQLFDGERSYQQISDLFFEQTGIRYGEQEIHDMADNLDAMEFWYKTPLEENLSLKQKLPKLTGIGEGEPRVIGKIAAQASAKPPRKAVTRPLSKRSRKV